MTEWIAFQKVSPQKEKTEDDIQNNFKKDIRKHAFLTHSV